MAITKGIFSHHSNLEDRFIPDYDKLADFVDRCKGIGLKVVLTQGVYDLIHEGHARYLEKAKSLGDLLIVGVDTDELTRSRKGPTRPIVPEEERISMLVHLRHVDVVTLRHINHDIGYLIRIVKPDVMVFSKSTKDIPAKDIREYKKYCGIIKVLPPQSTTSTSARIRLMNIKEKQQKGK